MKPKIKSFSVKLLLCIAFLTFLSMTAFAGTQTFLYDANGNLVNDSYHCYKINAANQLENITDCGANILAQYWYDYTGRKVKAIEGGVTIYYPFPEYEERHYPDGTNETISYFFANGELVARKQKDRQGVTKMYYYHGDHLGSTAVITDEQGNVVERVKYYPYGKVLSRTPQDPLNTRLYNGKEFSGITGLYYYEARQYRPDPPGFIQPDTFSQDPYDPQLFNRYAYARNNPLKYKDPSGHYIETAIDIAFIGMDVNDIQNDPGNGWNYLALTADVGGAILPGATGGRIVVKGVEYGGDVRKALEVSGKTEKQAILEANKIAGKEGEKAVQNNLEKQAGRGLKDSEKQVNIGDGSIVDFKVGDSVVEGAHEAKNINWGAKSYQTESGFNSRLTKVEKQVSRYQDNLGGGPLTLHITKPNNIGYQNKIVDMCTRNEVKLNWLERV